MKALQGYSVIVAEDNGSTRMMMSSMLTAHGAKVIEAENGQEAIHRLNQNDSVQMILMDLHMPVMDGYVATQKIRDFDKNIPIIAVTGASSDEGFELLGRGFSDFCLKPIFIKDLIAVMQPLLENTRKSLP